MDTDTQPSRPSNPVNTFIITAIIVLLILSVFTQYQLTNLGNKVDSLQKQNTPTVTATNTTPVVDTSSSQPVHLGGTFKLLAPKGGETLKIGQDFTIRWVAPADMRAVHITVGEPDGLYYSIGSVPANTNSASGSGSYVWKVGQVYNQVNVFTKVDTTTPLTLPEGAGYEIRISGVYGQTDQNVGTDALFTITK